jgi:putative salt-induced outer membrane protein YdiY
MNKSQKLPLLFLMVLPLCFAQEEEEKARPWTNKSEVQIVYSDGNSSTTTIGLSNKYAYKWDEDAEFNFNVFGVRSENETRSRAAFIEGSNINVVETEDSEVSEERYRAALKYRDKIKNKLHWFSGLEWQRNDISGIDARYIATAGLGHTWTNSKTAKFVTNYGVEYVREELSNDGEEDFAAIALGYEYMRQVTESTRFDQVFKVSGNTDEGEDYRAELESVLTVSISDKMALTTKLHLFYDNQPVVENVTVSNAMDGDPLTVEFELEGLETLFTTSLVINW